MPQFQEEKQKKQLEILKRKEEEESIRLLSEKYDIPYADLSTFPVELDALKIIPEEKARRAACAVFQATGKKIKIAVRNPRKEETAGILKHLGLEGYSYDLYLVSATSLEKIFSFYQKVPAAYEIAAGSIQVSSEKIETFAKEIRDLAAITEKIETSFKTRTTELLEIIVAGGLALDASDIHTEPRKEDVRLRYRLDGVLYDITRMPVPIYTRLLSRIKLISEMKLNIHDQAQEGRFTVKTGGIDIEVRSSLIPGPDGENIVMRILNPKSIEMRFEDLGMQPWVRERMEEELKKPNGMILTTGPTGSGKTTTLYAFLRKIHTADIKIITLEDPIEYHLPGIEQTQVETERGYGFASGLRAILRQDPDVILVGEIRDKETAETAIHAALTGHLVFSTLHTNNAAGTVPRLLDLGISPPNVAPAISVAMAQRLMRRICLFCRVPVSLTPKLKEKIKKEIALLPPHVPAPEEKTWTIFEAKNGGCETCSRVGYKGRIAVFEIILIDDAVERLILKTPSESELKKEARHQGQTTMEQDGLLKILAGITDFVEFERVLGAS